jgi:hypothetical protein
MKIILNHILTVALLLSAFASCKKNVIEPVQSSSLTIVNTIAGHDTLITNFDGNKQLQYFVTAASVLPGSFNTFSGYMGDIPLAISLANDTTHSIYRQTLNLTPNSIHTLFFMGTSTTPDMLLTNDNVQSPTDSVVKVRFVNISTGSNPVSINLRGSLQQPLASNLTYKSITDFQSFPAKRNNPISDSYVFEIRDAASQTLLATYTMTGLLPFTSPGKITIGKVFRSYTIAFSGVPGGTGTDAQGAILINNY